MEKHTTTSKHLAKAAMLLLVAMLTSMAAWANDAKYTYSVSWAQSSAVKPYTGRITSGSGEISLDYSSTNAQSHVLLKGGIDTPYITEKAFTIMFACDRDISTGSSTNTFKVTYPNTQFTISITNKNSVAYKIKTVTFLKSNGDEITLVTQIPTESSVSVLLSEANTEFAKIVVELTDATYYLVTPANDLKIVNTDGFVNGVKTYFLPNTDITLAPKSDIQVITATSGTVNTATIADDKRSVSFKMPTQDIIPSATLVEVHTVAISGDVSISDPLFTYNGKNYYEKGSTIQITAKNTNDIIDAISGFSGTITYGDDYKSASFTMPTSDLTLTATTSEVHTVSVPSNLTISEAHKKIGNTNYYKTGEKYTLTAKTNEIIDDITIDGVAVSINESTYKWATFTMPGNNITISATTSEVHTVSVPTNLTISEAYKEIGGTKYYKKDATYTLTAKTNEIIDDITIDGVAVSIDESTFKTATFKMPGNNIDEISATTSEVHTVSVPTNLSISKEYTTIGGTKYYKTDETYTLNVANDNDIIDDITIDGVEVNIDESTYKTATFTMPGNNIDEISATTSEVHTVSVPTNLTISEAYQETTSGIKYYKKGATYTLTAATADHMIDNITGVASEISADKRSATFEMPNEDITINATTYEVHTVSVPENLTISEPYHSYDSKNYYKAGKTYTLTAKTNEIIDDITIDGVEVNIDESTYKTATFTMPGNNITISATTTEVYTVSVPTNLTISNAYKETTSGTNYYKPGDTYTLTPSWTPDIITSISSDQASITLSDEKTTATFQMPAKDVAVTAITAVPYIDAVGNKAYCSEYTILTAATENLGHLPGGWYVVSGDVNINDKFYSDYDLNFIICDGATLTVNNTDIVSYENISIYGQTDQTGKIITTSDNAYNYMGIVCTNSLVINGCNIDVMTLQAESVTLNWFNANTSIKSDMYNGNVTIADGKAFYTVIDDKPYVLSGKLTSEQIDAIWGKTLSPCYALSFNNGDAPFGIPTQAVIPGKTPTEPTIKFQGKTLDWYSDAACTKPFDFTTPLTSNATAYTKVQVSYLDADGKSATCNDFTILTDATEKLGDLPGGWYVVAGDVNINKEIHSDYDLNLIICDGATLTVNNNNIVSSNNISIYGQTYQTGKIILTSTNENAYPYIQCPNLVINGSNIDVRYLRATTSVTLNWFNANTSIKSDRYNGNVTIADGKAFYTEIDGKPYVLSGKLTDEQIDAIKGKTLSPCYTLSFNNGNAPFGIPAQVVLPNEKPINPTSNYPGVKFSDWYSDAEYTTTFDFDKALTSNATAYTKLQVSYIDDKGESATCTDFKILTAATENLNALPGGWYVVADNVTLNTGIFSHGDLNLIICDGATLTGNNHSISSKNISIYGQTNQTGKITAYNIWGEKSVTINGGTIKSMISNSSNGSLIINGGNITGQSPLQPYQNTTIIIRGGNISVSEFITYGGSVTFDFANSTDRFITSAFSNNYDGAYSKKYTTYQVAEGKKIMTKDRSIVLSGTLTEANLLSIAGKTLMLCDKPDATPTAKDTYVINGDDEEIQQVIPKTVEVDEVILNRQFSQGIASTLILPFDYNASDFGEGSKFYKIEDVKYDEKSNQWTAEASQAQAELSANCPYIFYPAQDITEPIVFHNPKGGKITLHQTFYEPDYTTAESKWRLNGVYSLNTWSDRQDNIYGFAAKPVTNRDGKKIYAGEFVRAGRDSKIKPTRAYLEYVSDNGGNGGNISKSAVALPDRIVLVFPDETASVIDNPVDDPSTTGDDIETPTSEITPAANVKVWSYDKTIYIAAAPGTAYRIIDASGRPLRTSTTQSDRDEIHLGGKADGIVIVIIGGKAYKISF